MIPIRRGSVHLIADNLLTMLPTAQKIDHPTRPVVIISRDDLNIDAGWPFVIAIPISTSTKFRTPHCVAINAGNGNLPRKCWARTGMMQPLEKQSIGQMLGKLTEDRLQEIELRVAEYLGLIP